MYENAALLSQLQILDLAEKPSSLTSDLAGSSPAPRKKKEIAMKCSSAVENTSAHSQLDEVSTAQEISNTWRM
jgi:hypothetical protein